MSRITDLEQSIRESYVLIRKYEDIIRLSDRPRAKLRAWREMEAQWRLTEGCLLGCPLSRLRRRGMLLRKVGAGGGGYIFITWSARLVTRRGLGPRTLQIRAWAWLCSTTDNLAEQMRCLKATVALDPNPSWAQNGSALDVDCVVLTGDSLPCAGRQRGPLTSPHVRRRSRPL
jgi:hypothetical protein